MNNFGKTGRVFFNNQQMKGIGAEVHHGVAIIHAAKINIVAEMNAECRMSNSELRNVSIALSRKLAIITLIPHHQD